MEGEQLLQVRDDLVLYATGAAACSTSDLLMVLEAINRSLDNIEAASEPGLYGDLAIHTGKNRLLEVEDIP